MRLEDQSAFPGRVLTVIGECAQKEMAWIHTRRIVAAMEDAGVLGDLAQRERERDAMGFKQSPRAATFTNLAIALIVRASKPTPAAWSALHLPPEPH